MNSDPLWTEFSQIGEDRVRQDLAASRYREEKRDSAREWLAHLQRTEQRAFQERMEAISREQNQTARSAKNAAWAAATAAIIAAISAAISIVISLLKQSPS